MAEERKVQLGFAVDADGVKQGLNEIKQDVREMARDVEQSGQRAGQGLGKIGDGAPEAQRKVDGAARSIIGSIERATAAMQAGTKGSAEYYEALARQRGVSADAIKPYIDQLKAAERAQKAATSGLGSMEMSAKQTTAALRQVPAQFTDIIVSLQGGQAPMTVLLQQGGQLKDVFGGVGAAARALGGYVLGLVNPFSVAAAGVATLGYAYAQGSKEADAYRMAMVTTGNAAGATSGQLKSYAQEVAATIGTQGKAAESLAQLASSGKVANEVLREAAQASIAYERATGQAMGKTAESFASLGGEPLKAVLKLNESMNFLTESTYRQVKSLEEQGRTAEAAAVAQRSYADALTSRAGEIERNLGSIERGWLNVKNMAKSAWDAMLNVGRADTNEDKLASINKQIAELEKRRAGGFGETEGGAAIGRPSSAAQASVQAELAALGAQKAALEGVIHAERERGKQEAENAANRKLYYDWDQKGATFATKAQQRDAEILRARTEGQQLVNAGLITQAQLEERVGAIRKKYEEKPSSGAAGTGQNEVAAIRAKIAETERYLTALQEQGAEAEKLTEGEKLVIKIQEELKTSISGVARAQKEKALAAAQTLAALDRQIVREQELVKANAKAEAEYRNGLAAMADKTDAIDKQARELEAANAAFGKSKIAIEEYTTAQKQDQLAKLQALGLQGEFTAELEREIAARQRLTDAMREAAYKSANAKFDEALTQAREQNDLVREEISLIGLTEVERKKIIAAREVEIELAKELREIDKLGLGDAQAEELRIKARAKARTKAETAQAKATLDDWQKTADQINQSLTDALLRGFESGKGFAENFRDTLKNLINTLVLRPIIQAIIQPVAGGVTSLIGGVGPSGGGGGAGLLGMAGNVASIFGVGGVAGSLAAGAGWLTGATTLGGSLTAGASLIGTGTLGGAAAGAGMLAGALAPIALGIAVLPSIISALFGRKLKDSGIEGQFGGETGFEGRQYEYYKGGLFRSNKTKYKDLDEETRSALGDQFLAMRQGTLNMAEILGLGTDAISSFTAKIKVSLKGLSAEEAQKKLQEEFDKIAESLASTALGTDDFSRKGENAVDTLVRLSTSLSSVNGIFDTLGLSIYDASLSAADAASSFIDLFGGIENLNAAARTYYENFYSDDERRDKQREELDKLFESLGLEKIDYDDPEARKKYREIVEREQQKMLDAQKGREAVRQSVGSAIGIRKPGEGADGVGAIIDSVIGNTAMPLSQEDLDRINGLFETFDAGKLSIDDLKGSIADVIAPVVGVGKSADETVAALLNASGAFAEVTQSSDQAAEASRRAAEEAKRAAEEAAREAERKRQEAIRSTYDLFRRAIDRDRDLLQERASGIEEVIGTITGAVDLLKSSAKELYGTVDSTAQMLAAQGMVYIEQALDGVRSGKSIAGYDGLAEAIEAARGGISGGVYASQFDRDRDALVLAGQLSELGERGELQLSVQERQLKAINEQIEYLDNLAKRADELVNGTAALTGTVDYYFQQLMGLLGKSAAVGGTPGNSPAEVIGGSTGPSAPPPLTGIAPGSKTEDGRYYIQQPSLMGGGHSTFRETTAAETARLGTIDKWIDKWRGTGDVAGLLLDAKASGYRMLDLATVMGWDYGDLVRAGKNLGIPQFAVGTNYVPRDMVAQIHQGEAIVPKAFNPWAGGQGMQAGNAELVAEVRALREDNRAQAGQIVRLHSDVAKLLQRWDGDGLPQARQEALA